MATVGGGVQYNMSDRVALRGEIAARYDHDNNTVATSADALGYNVSPQERLMPMASSASAWCTASAVAPKRRSPPPPAETRRRPAAAGPVEDSGPPQKVVIDLRGVNFKFDRPKAGEHNIEPTLQVPTADSVAILDQAIDALKRYPEIKVELDGHTDSIGTDAYNQKLSERRAQIVYDYLTAHGIDASRITAVKGFGENAADRHQRDQGRPCAQPPH